jgi:hypothetical protein
MARQRRSSRKTENESPTEVDSGNANVTPTHERTVTKMAGLTPEAVAALLSKTRTKGQYIQYLNEFVDSGEMGVEVGEQWVALKDKKGTTLKQGFDNAKDNKEAREGSENVQVIKQDEKVYLVNLAHEELSAQTEEAAA